MSPVRLRFLLNPFFSSSLSNHFDKSTKQLSRAITTDHATHWKTKKYTKDTRIVETDATTTNDADRIRKHRRDEKLMERLQDIKLYVDANQDTFIDLCTKRDGKVTQLDGELSYSPGLNKKSRQFIEDILKDIHEAVLEYKSSDEKHSPDKSTGSSDHKTTCTASTAQKIPAEPTLDSDKNDGNSGNEKHSPDKSTGSSDHKTTCTAQKIPAMPTLDSDKNDGNSGNDRDSANDKDGQKSDKVDQYVHDRELSFAFWCGVIYAFGILSISLGATFIFILLFDAINHKMRKITK